MTFAALSCRLRGHNVQISADARRLPERGVLHVHRNFLSPGQEACSELQRRPEAEPRVEASESVRRHLATGGRDS